jgi:hypothetical protein
METDSTQQEILLFTGTSLSELLPVLNPQPGNKKTIYLCKIREGVSFLEFDLGSFPPKKDGYYSIDPYLCIDRLCNN